MNINSLYFKSNQLFYYIRFLKEQRRHSILCNFYTAAITIFCLRLNIYFIYLIFLLLFLNPQTYSGIDFLKNL